MSIVGEIKITEIFGEEFLLFKLEHNYTYNKKGWPTVFIVASRDRWWAATLGKNWLHLQDELEDIVANIKKGNITLLNIHQKEINKEWDNIRHDIIKVVDNYYLQKQKEAELHRNRFDLVMDEVS